MTLEMFQLLAWLEVIKSAITTLLYVIFIIVYKRIGKVENTKGVVGFSSLDVLPRAFLLTNLISLMTASFHLSNCLTSPEETFQQFIEWQFQSSFGSSLTVPEELITGKGEKSV